MTFHSPSLHASRQIMGSCGEVVQTSPQTHRRQRVTFEHFNTLIIEIESNLNSGPLTPISTDPSDFLVLIPCHFLIGNSLMSLRERDFKDTPSNRLSRWRYSAIKTTFLEPLAPEISTFIVSRKVRLSSSERTTRPECSGLYAESSRSI